MAEGFLRELSKGDFEVESAGVVPSKVRPEAIESMREVGIDIFKHRSNQLIICWISFRLPTLLFSIMPKKPARLFRQNNTIHQSFTDPPPETIGDYESRLKIFREARD
jgi:hypothetical protein